MSKDLNCAGFFLIMAIYIVLYCAHLLLTSDFVLKSRAVCVCVIAIRMDRTVVPKVAIAAAGGDRVKYLMRNKGIGYERDDK